MLKPNFLIIGAPKSGTTSLYNYLAQHPDVFMSANKEPKFFAFEGCDLNFNGPQGAVKQLKESTTTTYSEYLSLFRAADEFSAVGEASPIYLHFPGVPQKIKDYYPGIKLIALLRNPIERLYSDWKHNLRMGFETETNFLNALDLWHEREMKNWIPYVNYLPKGFYSQHLNRYYAYFERNQIKVSLYEDFAKSPHKIVSEIFQFLKLRPNVEIDTSTKFMVGQPIPRNVILAKLLEKTTMAMKDLNLYPLKWIIQYLNEKNSIPERMTTNEFSYVSEIYRSDILDLQDLINRDLSHWLKP